jgi:hypothetical protein
MPKPITDQEIEQLARAYCRQLGEDPDGASVLVKVERFAEGGSPEMVRMGAPNWETHKARARDVIAMQRALAEVGTINGGG